MALLLGRLTSKLASAPATKVNLTSKATFIPGLFGRKPGGKKESLRSILASFYGGKIDTFKKEDEVQADDLKYPHPVDYATGEEKLMLLAFEQGYIDPFCTLPVKRGDRGTKDRPVQIRSFEDEAIVACVCEEDQHHMKHMLLYRGEPKRCLCGYWMEIVDAPKFWESISKEDLIDIPFFRDLDEKGKLDILLSGKLNLEESLKIMHGGGGHH